MSSYCFWHLLASNLACSCRLFKWEFWSKEDVAAQWARIQFSVHFNFVTVITKSIKLGKFLEKLANFLRKLA